MGRLEWTHSLSDFVLLETEIARQSGICLSLFQRIEIFTLKILDQCHFEDISIRGLS